MISRLYKKYYTVKQWNKFSIEHQEQLTKRYDCILTDHKIKKEKIKEILKKFNKKNLDTGITKFQRVMDKVDRGFKEFDKYKKKSLIGMSKRDHDELFYMPKKNYDNILGKSDKRDYSFLTGKK